MLCRGPIYILFSFLKSLEPCQGCLHLKVMTHHSIREHYSVIEQLLILEDLFLFWSVSIVAHYKCHLKSDTTKNLVKEWNAKERCSPEESYALARKCRSHLKVLAMLHLFFKTCASSAKLALFSLTLILSSPALPSSKIVRPYSCHWGDSRLQLLSCRARTSGTDDARQRVLPQPDWPTTLKAFLRSRLWTNWNCMSKAFASTRWAVATKLPVRLSGFITLI